MGAVWTDSPEKFGAESWPGSRARTLSLNFVSGLFFIPTDSATGYMSRACRANLIWSFRRSEYVYSFTAVSGMDVGVALTGDTR
jgi:hypothetical protein